MKLRLGGTEACQYVIYRLIKMTSPELERGSGEKVKNNVLCRSGPIRMVGLIM